MWARELARGQDYAGAVKCLEESPQGARDITLHPDILETLWKLSRPPQVLPPCWDLETYGCLPQWDRSKALILHGRSGFKKSSLARSLMPTALFCSHMEDVRMLDRSQHEGLILDDMNFMGDPLPPHKGRWPRESQIHLVDYDFPRSLHARYKNIEIPAGTPKIFTTNLSPREMLMTMDPAIQRRTASWFVDGTTDVLFYTVQW